jgi:hypothetical protein
MARVRKRAADISLEKAAVLGPNVMVRTDEGAGDEQVLRIEQSPDNYEDLELAKRRAADAKIAEAWRSVGGLGPSRPATPLRGSLCAHCGSTTSVLGSAGASGPYTCAFGCS